MDNNIHVLPKILFADPSQIPGGPQQVGVTILENLNKTKYDLIIGSPTADHPMAKSLSFRYCPEIHNIGKPKNKIDRRTYYRLLRLERKKDIDRKQKKQLEDLKLQTV